MTFANAAPIRPEPDRAIEVPSLSSTVPGCAAFTPRGPFDSLLLDIAANCWRGMPRFFTAPPTSDCSKIFSAHHRIRGLAIALRNLRTASNGSKP
jgi:hypothetical protein